MSDLIFSSVVDERLMNGCHLSRGQSRMLMRSILQGEISDELLQAILVAFSTKGETIDELTGMVEVMRTFVVPVDGHVDAIDTCGTGGSGLPRINTSTMSAFVLASGGVKVAKHGNRASGGRCGSFDVLEAVGARIDLSPGHVERSLSELGIGFMFAPLYHPAMKHVGPARRALGIRTVFNILGPLVNPAGVRRQVIGVSDPSLADRMMAVLQQLGHQRVVMVHGHDGLDEITLTGPTTVHELVNGTCQIYEISPEDLGLESVDSFESISGGAHDMNARLFEGILCGEIRGPRRDLVLANAAAGFLVAGRVDSLKEGVQLARRLIDSGDVQRLFNDYVRFTNAPRLSKL